MPRQVDRFESPNGGAFNFLVHTVNSPEPTVVNADDYSRNGDSDWFGDRYEFVVRREAGAPRVVARFMRDKVVGIEIVQFPR